MLPADAYPPTDIDLAHAWLHTGDQDAARALIARHHPQVMAIAHRHCPAGVAAEELAQDAWVRIFQSLPRYEPRRPLAHWVARITINLCRDRLRAAGRRPELRLADLREGERAALAEGRLADPGEADREGRAGRVALVTRLLETLEADDRIVLTLFQLENRSAAEVSALTGWSVIAVRARALRARARARVAAERLARES